MMKKITSIVLCVLMITVMICPALLTVVSAEEEEYVDILSFGWMQEDFYASDNSVEDEYIAEDGTVLPYCMYVPADYDPEQSYPLVLYFHTAGERGNDNTHIFRNGTIMTRLLTPEELEKHPCIILAPQCGAESKWVLTDWLYGVYDHTQIEKSPYMTAAEELLEIVIDQYSVDQSRLYVTGCSMGGFGTWDIISRNPDKFAAAIPICGGVDESYLENLKGMPIRAFHAVDDDVVFPAGSQKAGEVLTGHGDFLYTEYKSGGHQIWDRVHRTAYLMDWLFAQSLDNRGGETPAETEVVETSPVVEDVEIIGWMWLQEDFILSKNSVEAVYTAADGTELPYCMYVPDDYDPEKSYPLVLSLHGAGERGDDNTHVFRGGSIMQRLLVPAELEKHPCIILAPQCASDSQWVLSPWEPGTYDHTEIEKSPYMSAAEELLDKVLDEYSVDRSRLYVTGISMGGFGTWDIISRNPDKFAAAIPICGGVDESYLESLKGMPIRTFHAADDPTVSVDGSRKASEILTGHGDFLYTEFELGGHGIWDRVHRTGDLMDWLFAQSLDNRISETPAETADETEGNETSPVAEETVSDAEVSESDSSETAAEAPAESLPESAVPSESEGEGLSIVGIAVIVGAVLAAVVVIVIVLSVKKKK